MKPSVLIVHNRYAVLGGEERVVEQQAAVLKENGHRVDFYQEDSGAFQKKSNLSKLAAAVQTPFSLKHYRGLRGKIRRFNPDIVHVHNVFPLLTPSVYLAAAHEEKPVVQSLHNYRFLCSNGLFLLPDGRICERCVPGSNINAVLFGCYSGSRFRSAGIATALSVHQAFGTFKKKIAAYIAPSHFLKAKLTAAGFPAEKFHLCPSGISPLPSRTRDREEKTLVFLGRLSREKGLKTLLAAMAESPDWTLRVIGEGPLRAEIENEIREKNLSNVVLLGRLEGAGVAQELQKATFLILPSECYENMPTVILEAWCYGIPVVVSDLGGMAEIVEEGKTGFKFKAGDAAALAALLKKIDKKNSESLASCVMDVFREKYSADSFYDRLMNVYASIA